MNLKALIKKQTPELEQLEPSKQVETNNEKNLKIQLINKNIFNQ